MNLLPLGEIAEVIAGQSPAGVYYNAIGKGAPFYQGKKDFGEKYLGKPTTWTTKVTKSAKLGDILMSVRAPVGPINFATEDICIGRGLAAIRASARVNRDFLFYFLLFKQPVISGNTGAVFDSISREQICAIEIPLPSQERQRAIVEKLDRAFVEIDSNIKTTIANLASLQLLFDSYLDSLIQYQIGAVGEKKLEDVLEIARGGSPRPIKSYLTADPDGINWVKISDASASTKYIRETAQRIKKSGIAKSRIVNPGDFLLSNSMSFGRPYIMATTGCIHDGWLVLSNSQQLLNPDYLYYLLGSRFVFNQFNRSAAGSTVRNLNMALAGKVTFPVPDLKTQALIVAKVTAFEKLLNELKSATSAKIDALGELRSSFLSEAFTFSSDLHEVA